MSEEDGIEHLTADEIIERWGEHLSQKEFDALSEHKKCLIDPIYFYEKYALFKGKKPPPLKDYEKEFLRESGKVTIPSGLYNRLIEELKKAQEDVWVENTDRLIKLAEFIKETK